MNYIFNDIKYFTMVNTDSITIYSPISVSEFGIVIKGINAKITQQHNAMELFMQKIKRTQSEIIRLQKEFETLESETKQFRSQINNLTPILQKI